MKFEGTSFESIVTKFQRFYVIEILEEISGQRMGYLLNLAYEMRI